MLRCLNFLDTQSLQLKTVVNSTVLSKCGKKCKWGRNVLGPKSLVKFYCNLAMSTSNNKLEKNSKAQGTRQVLNLFPNLFGICGFHFLKFFFKLLEITTFLTTSCLPNGKDISGNILMLHSLFND